MGLWARDLPGRARARCIRRRMCAREPDGAEWRKSRGHGGHAGNLAHPQMQCGRRRDFCLRGFRPSCCGAGRRIALESAAFLQTVASVLKHLHLLECDKAARDHLVEHRKEFIDLGFAIDNFDDDRQVLGQPQDLGGM